MGEIKFNNVTLTYDKEKPPFIENLNLHIRPGEKVCSASYIKVSEFSV